MFEWVLNAPPVDIFLREFNLQTMSSKVFSMINFREGPDLNV